MTDLLGLNGRTVIVSGAAGGGIGTAVTEAVARAGATVVAVSRSPENLDRHIGPLVAAGLPIVPVAADAGTGGRRDIRFVVESEDGRDRRIIESSFFGPSP